MIKSVCHDCQCNNCFLAIPDGGAQDCHYCDFCDEEEPKLDCKKIDPIHKNTEGLQS